MNNIRFALLALAAISPVPLSAQAADVDVSQPASPPMSRQQLGAEMGREFDVHDYDHDGFLSWQEWEKSNRNDPEFKTNGRIVFDHMDANHDNRLARQEMVDWSLRLYDCLDENRDEAVTDAEGQNNIQRCMMSETGVSMPQPRDSD